MNEVEKAEHSALFALFLEYHVQPDSYVDLEDLYRDYGLKFPKAWLESSLSEWADAGWVDIARSHDGTAASIESNRYNSVLKQILGWLGGSKLTVRAKNEEIYSDIDPPNDIPMKEGWKWFTYEGDVQTTRLPNVPASDRFVALDHNSAAYAEVAEQLQNVSEAVRGHNSDDIPLATRDRVVASLDAARILWNAAELRLIQIKVGILMAAEDAVRILAGTARTVAAALLVDTIKAYVKNHFGVDLDKI